MSERYDVVVIGASFAGLSCASALAEEGIRVLVLERKKDVGEGIHTTGIIVKEAADGFDLPERLVRSIEQVRLYSPSLKCIDLYSRDYFFLATDTPNTMRYLARRAEAKGVTIRYGCAFEGGELNDDGSILLARQNAECTFLIGADGPRSAVAKSFGLGINNRFLLGVEAEFSIADVPSRNAFYCFLNQKLAYGYLGWVVPGVDVVQVGLATRMPIKPDIDAFIDHLQPLFSLEKKNIVARRGGLIPVGGRVAPLSKGNVILLGDAAGTVSPLSAGGIHAADYCGKRLAHRIAGHLRRQTGHPSTFLSKDYPTFGHKHLKRFVFERLAPNWLLDLTIGGFLFRMFARVIFFRDKRLG